MITKPTPIEPVTTNTSIPVIATTPSAVTAADGSEDRAHVMSVEIPDRDEIAVNIEEPDLASSSGGCDPRRSSSRRAHATSPRAHEASDESESLQDEDHPAGTASRSKRLCSTLSNSSTNASFAASAIDGARRPASKFAT
jgi:hypothetical protein